MLMQVRSHSKDQTTKKIWLSHEEKERLLEVHRDYPMRQTALRLGLHGLRTVEIMGVAKDHFRELDESDSVFKLYIPESSAKSTTSQGSDARETPISERLYRNARIYANSTGKNNGEPLMDVGKRSVRRWIESARSELYEETGESGWRWVSYHDLRRTWATDTYWSLAFAGNPAAEELTMSWGGWSKTATGIETFRESYLGPVPDHITIQAAEDLEYL